MKKRSLFIVFYFFFFSAWCQSNMIDISSSVPSQMTICGAAKIFTITIYNPSPFTLTNDTIKVDMPSGVNYQVGSVTGALEISGFSINDNPFFYVASIPSLTTLTITYFAEVGCNIMQYTAAGGIVENHIKVDYTANNTQNYDTKNSGFYLIRQPNLSITNITNQSYVGSVGGAFNRCITITNGGLGELSQFTFTDIHQAGIQIAAVTNGTWVNSGLTETITFTGIDFSTIGDGDNLFENGEEITVCETVNIINCDSVGSAFEAYWGCNGQHCQSSISNAN